MRFLKFLLFFFAASILVLMTRPVLAGGHHDIGREILPPNDGWASFGEGTTGGSQAVPEQVYVVTNRAELIAALNDGEFSSTSPSSPSNEPKIIYVDGIIDGNVDDNNQPLTLID
jgi:pectate lyase